MISRNLQIAVFLCLAGLALLVMAITHKREVPPPPAPVQSESNLDNYINKLEAERDEELDEKAQAEKRVKLSAAKRNSVECQFWMQQEARKSDPKNQVKIKENCELPDTQ